MSRRRHGLRVRCLLGLCLVISLGAIPTASGSSAALPVQTLLEVRGAIEGFAQDGRYVTWANPTPAYTNPRACTRIVQLRDLRTKKTWPLVATKSSLCREIRRLGGFQHRMALAGTRALWGLVTVSNSSFHVALHMASPGRRSRALTEVSMSGGLEGRYPFRPVPVAGDGASLVFAHTGDSEEQEPYGVVRVGRTGMAVLAGTKYSSAVAVQAGRTLLTREVQAGCVCNDSPEWSPNGEQIAFASGRAEGGPHQEQLHVMQADGSGLRVLPVGKKISTPRWSPDGRLLAFTQADSVFVAEADGRGLRRVGTGFQPSWSPDGRWLAVARSGDDTSVFRVPARGGTPSRIASGWDPHWSPDGTQLVVSREHSLYVVGADGSGARRIATADHSLTGRWSPDGKLIAFSSYDDDPETWVVAADGTNLRRLSNTSVAFEWSPDSRSLVGTRRLKSPAGDTFFETLVVIAADGSGERNLGPGWEPTWSRDGAAIAFVAIASTEYGKGEIARISADGSDRRVLTQTTPEPGRNAIELRATATGRVLSSFDTERLPSEVALAGSRVALLYAKPRQLEIRTLSGSLLRQASVAGAVNLSLSGRWTLYRTGRTIRALDVQSGKSIVVARAAASPVGLSLDGRRVAWAEQGRRTSRIRAVVLPK